MKRFIVFILLFVLIQETRACEFCGCSSGNYFISPFPQFNKYFVGTRYTFRSFKTVLADDPDEFSNDFYQSIELWGGINVGKHWQVLGFLPYNINRIESDEGTQVTRGLGDATLLANYNLLRTQKETGANHQIWLGGGVKLPTGRYEVDHDDLLPSANSQPGSGSLDFVANALYTLRVNKWALNGSLNYKMNQSASGFQFGNRFAASVFAYRSIPSGKNTFNPSVGILHEQLAANRLYSAEVESTGGHSLMAATGLDTNFRKITVGFNVQLPLSHHYSGGQTDTKLRGLLHVTYTF